MGFFYFQRGLESRPCCEILYKMCTRIMCALFCVFSGPVLYMGASYVDVRERTTGI